MGIAAWLWQKGSSALGDPVAMRRANGWLTLGWFLAALPICIWLSESVPFLVFISVYAVVTGHLSTWQAARVEAKQAADADVEEVRKLCLKILERLDRDAL